MSGAPSIAIIGAGFSGSVLAARLLRGATPPLRILLINRSGRLARGVAYGTRSDSHVLNVPAGRMSALPEDAEHFLKFAQTVDPSISSGTFVVRRLYGEYLEQLLNDAERDAAPGAPLEQVVGEVVDVQINSTVQLRLADGRVIQADRVVLASGNYPPADPPFVDDAMRESNRYIRDPWTTDALLRVPADSSVLLVGTGLTMFDVALELSRGGMKNMLAISRRGLLPHPHRSPSLPPAHDHLPPDLVAGPATALGYLRSIRRHAIECASRGIDWRDVIASLRPITPRLWQKLGAIERRRFLHRLKPYWDVHRHRAAPETFAGVKSLIDRGALSVAAGRITVCRPRHDSVEIAINLRAGGRRVAAVSHVINCTGPDSNIVTIRDPLLDSLLKRGLASIDEAGVGLRTTDEYRLIGERGVQERLFLLGPLLRGKLWEATAVPELRVHARELAKLLLAT